MDFQPKEIWMLRKDKDGWITSLKIHKEHRPAIEKAPIGTVTAIVLHRTGSNNAQSVLNSWESKQEGTHFLISEAGKIYQTASLNNQCWHVGKLYSKCRAVSSCEKEDAEAIEGILHKKNTNWGKKFKLVTRHELKKDYPARFPHNIDSIGIEIVGLISKTSEIYETPNNLQLNGLFWLVDELVSTYGLSIKDLYAHGQIAHKDTKKSEGTSSLNAYAIHRGK